MGFDELQPLSKHGVDGLGGLGAIVVDALGIVMIMGSNNIVKARCMIMDQEGVAYQTKQERTCCYIKLLYLFFTFLRDIFETYSWQITYI
jgi:hypothetical protein